MVFPLMGREFLPPFNEGALNINITLPPGTSLQESNRIGRTVEEVLHRTPEVVSTTRRTGRAELDEHAAGVSMSEIEVVTRALGRPHTAVMEEVRQNLAQIPGVVSEVGQPISHRIDHLLSGTRAQIAIKLFGSDLVTLRNKGEEIRKAMETVPGVVDLMLEPQTGVPQVQINLDRRAAAALGLRADTLAETVDVAFNGEAVSQVLEDQRTYDVVVRYNDASRQSVETIASTLVDTPAGAKVPLNQVAEIRVDQGPNTINRENVQRRIIVQANVANRDLGSIIDEIRAKIARDVPLPEGYFVQYGGQFEAQEAASRQITVMSGVAVAGIFLLLYLALRSGRPGFARDGQSAAGSDWRSADGVCIRRHIVHRFLDWVYHAVRDSDPQRNHADHALPAFERRGRRSISPVDCAGIDRASQPYFDDGAGDRCRIDSAGAGCGTAREGNPTTDGGGDSGRNRHLDVPEHDRDSGALPQVWAGWSFGDGRRSGRGDVASGGGDRGFEQRTVGSRS